MRRYITLQQRKHEALHKFHMMEIVLLPCEFIPVRILGIIISGIQLLML